MRYFFILFLLIPCALQAQQLRYPLNRQMNRQIEQRISHATQPVHTSFRPVVQSQTGMYQAIDSALYLAGRDSAFLSARKHLWGWEKLRTENFAEVNGSDYSLIFNPLFYLELSDLTESFNTFNINKRGAEFKAHLGNKFSFSTRLYENQGVFVDYVDDYINRTVVVPGHAPAKRSGTNGHDFAYATGYLSLSPWQFLNLQLGHGKHFVGEGYRSLLLSDNAPPYPFFKLTSTFGQFQYSALFTQLQGFYTGYWNYGSAVLAYHFRKHATFNYLSWTPHHRVEVGLFEGIMWQTTDTATYTNEFDVNFFNPVIFTRLPEYGLNDENNMLLGANVRIKVLREVQLYGQFVLDNIDFEKMSDGDNYFQNKTGYQLGCKVYDAFFGYLPWQKLFFRLEYNEVAPYTYAHSTPVQNFSHLNQPLAHPLGAGFKESVLVLRYHLWDFFVEYQRNNATTSADENGNYYGSNIFVSDEAAWQGTDSYGNEIGQGREATITFSRLRVGFLLNPRTNLHLFVGTDKRNWKTAAETKESSYTYFGIRTNLNNFYYDF